MIASNSAETRGRREGGERMAAWGMPRKEGREKCHTFLGTNLRGETAATPSPPLYRTPLQRPPPRGPVYCFTYSPMATGQQRYFVYKFWLLREGGKGWLSPFPLLGYRPTPARRSRCTAVSVLSGRIPRETPRDSGHRGVELSSGTSRAPSGVGKQDVV